jgi:hypothetical protein
MLQRLADAFGVTPASSLLKEVALQDLHILNTRVVDVAEPVVNEAR